MSDTSLGSVEKGGSERGRGKWWRAQSKEKEACAVEGGGRGRIHGEGEYGTVEGDDKYVLVADHHDVVEEEMDAAERLRVYTPSKSEELRKGSGR